MSILAIPVGPLAHAWKALFVANPVAGVVVAAVAIAGYGIYEHVFFEDLEHTFTVGEKKLDSYLADVDTDDKFTPDTEVIDGGVFYESKHRSAPYFDIQIDGITLLNTNFG